MMFAADESIAKRYGRSVNSRKNFLPYRDSNSRIVQKVPIA